MEFRRADAGDIPHLTAMRQQQLIDEITRIEDPCKAGKRCAATLRGLVPTCDIRARLADYFASALADGTLIAYLAIDRSAVVATGGVCFYRLPPSYSNPSGRVAYITNVFTQKSYCGRGIATRMVGLLIEEARRSGVALIRLHASVQGRSIYERLGFTDSHGYMALRLSPPGGEVGAT